MTHGSLFSGLGGFDLAARWMGWRNAFNCEIDGFCSRVLGYHFPESEHYGDIRTTDFTKWRGRIDVLSGGFPCQPFSVAGRRRGADDDRYLWPEMLRVIREIRPAWVIGENVAGILTMVQPGEETEVASEASIFGEGYEETELRQRHVVETVCEDLEREGYSVQPLVIPACAVGAPHRRDRVWFVAHRDDAGAEGQRPEREDGIHASGIPADAHLDRRRIRKDQQVSVPELEGASDNSTCGKDGSSSDPDGERRRHGGDNRGARPLRDELRRDIEEDQPERDGRERGTGEDGAPAPHTDSPGFEGECERGQGEAQTHGRDSEDIQSRWRDFPTQSPVCGGHDGISGGLGGISFPRWRTESVKAYGNAVVPQVVYEIFRAIEMAEDSYRQ